jgi:hypothetical protein
MIEHTFRIASSKVALFFVKKHWLNHCFPQRIPQRVDFPYILLLEDSAHCLIWLVVEPALPL